MSTVASTKNKELFLSSFVLVLFFSFAIIAYELITFSSESKLSLVNILVSLHLLFASLVAFKIQRALGYISAEECLLKSKKHMQKSLFKKYNEDMNSLFLKGFILPLLLWVVWVPVYLFYLLSFGIKILFSPNYEKQLKADSLEEGQLIFAYCAWLMNKHSRHGLISSLVCFFLWALQFYDLISPFINILIVFLLIYTIAQLGWGLWEVV